MDPALFRVGQQPFGLAAQPFGRDLAQQFAEALLQPGEVGFEDLVEPVEMAFVLDQAGPAQEVEAFDVGHNHATFEGFEQGQQLGDRHRDAGRAQLEEQLNEHRVGSRRPDARTGECPVRS